MSPAATMLPLGTGSTSTAVASVLLAAADTGGWAGLTGRCLLGGSGASP